MDHLLCKQNQRLLAKVPVVATAKVNISQMTLAAATAVGHELGETDREIEVLAAFGLVDFPLRLDDPFSIRLRALVKGVAQDPGFADSTAEETLESLSRGHPSLFARAISAI